MRPSVWPMRSSSSKVRTTKVTSQSGDALVIDKRASSKNYLHADTYEGNRDSAIAIDSTAAARRAPSRARRARAASCRQRARSAASSRNRVSAGHDVFGEQRDLRRRAARVAPRRGDATIGRPAASAFQRHRGRAVDARGNGEHIGGGEQRELVVARDVSRRSARACSPRVSRETPARDRRRRRAASRRSGSGIDRQIEPLSTMSRPGRRRRSRRPQPSSASRARAARAPPPSSPARWARRRSPWAPRARARRRRAVASAT